MPLVSIQGAELDLPRNLALLDTNVLVALMNEQDGDHEQAELAIDELDFEWLVTSPVIVESCGLLTSRRGAQYVVRLVQWLSTPGNVTLLPTIHSPAHESRMFGERGAWMQQFAIDYVDSHLMEIANVLTELCCLRPHAPIVTFDTKDFFRCAERGKRYSLYDMRDLDLVVFD